MLEDVRREKERRGDREEGEEEGKGRGEIDRENMQRNKYVSVT